MRSGLKRARILLILPAAVLIIGIAGFMTLEGLSFIDAIYLTVVTISTVGYGDIYPTTTPGKIFGIFLIIIGIGTFLTIITSLTQQLVQRGRDKLRHQRLHMLVGVFFTEMGNHLLGLLVQFDPNVDEIRRGCLVDETWSANQFNELKKRLRRYEFTASTELMDLEAMLDFLKLKGDILIRQIENPDLLEHESFTELLWAIIHLRDELLSRKSLKNLPGTDTTHLANDIQRIYTLLVRQWLEYLQYLKRQYPFLFSLALRINPFCEDASAIVE